MQSTKFIQRIRKFSVISLLLPLIAINSCFLIYKLLGDIQFYHNFNWNEKKIEYKINTYNSIKSNKKKSFVNCPKYKFKEYRETIDNEINSVILEQGNILNNKCVKNYPFIYPVLKNFNSLEKLLLFFKTNNPSGFAEVKNPYIYGEVSISRTSRYFPATMIFKPLVILTAIFLFLYWKNNFNLFNELKNQNILNSFSKNFFYFGILSCIFLILHAVFLGVDFDSKLFSRARRIIIILFILFELFDQISLTILLFKFKEKLIKSINFFILKTKIVFISIVFVITSVSFVILGWGNPSYIFKNVLEWNYFTLLLFYYGLSRLLWKKV